MVAAALVGAVVGAPATARADRGGGEEAAAAIGAARCPRGATPVRIDTKTCPALKRRPSFVVQRACCAHLNGKVHCGHMPHCPTNSPS
jgi:hypothetical protein